ncbi:MAG TPA: carboxypeptidase-like regulatory domain-containing protein, partial [Solirubrobacteraceae bacterium]|nr:carboxypeptidase-like regulatory domain-containing protein [Solirubrobacteraceae bacterium]
MLVIVGGLASAAQAGGGNPTGPEYGRCVQVPAGSGEFENPNCTIPVSGSGASWKFEPAASVGPPPTFTASFSPTKFSSEVGTVECTGGSAAGTITGPKTAEETVSLTSCSYAGKHCSSPGAASGTITTGLLQLELGWIDQGRGEVGVSLKSASAAPISESECENGVKTNVVGGIIGVLQGTRDAMSTSSTVTYSETFGHQLPDHFEAGPTETLTQEIVGYGDFALTEQSRGIDEFSEKLEINTIESLTTAGGTGSVSGTVSDSGATPVGSATVSICDRQDGTCYSAETDAQGHYEASNVEDGEYVAQVSPPGSAYLGATSPSFTVSTGAPVIDNFTLQSLGSPSPPPGTEITSNGTTTVSGQTLPVIYWGAESPITTHACPGGTVTAFVTAYSMYTLEPEATELVTLGEVTLGSGEFEGELPVLFPRHGEGTVTISVGSCPQPSEDGTTEFPIYIDPSGTVVDGNHGEAPVEGATVTLLSAPTLEGTYTPVPEGSDVMSLANRKNPFTTGPDGAFAWDTQPGFYEIEASKPECGSATSGPFEVPPPAFDLKLVLHCVVPEPSASVELRQRIQGTSTYTAEQLEGHIGQVVEYEITVKNTGNVPIKPEPFLDAECEDLTTLPAELAVGETATATCSATLPAERSYPNEAFVGAFTAGGAGTIESSNEVVVLLPPEGKFTIGKLQRAGSTGSFVNTEIHARVGEAVQYEIVITNTGNEWLEFYELEDAGCEDIAQAPSELEPGESATVT